MVGTVFRVEGKSVFVQWHNVAVDDELDSEEVVSTGRFQKSVHIMLDCTSTQRTWSSSRSTMTTRTKAKSS